MSSPYPPIESYGVVGNLETCALIGPTGAIEWYPVPHLESPSVFAASLDATRGGHFRVCPSVSTDSDLRYLPRTNVLQTTFETDTGELSVTDFMPPADLDASHTALYRKVDGVDGTVDFDVAFAPQLNYAQTETRLSPREVAAPKGGTRTGGDDRWTTVVATGGDQRLVLLGEVEFERDENRATASETIQPGESRWFVLTHGDHAHSDREPAPPGRETCEQILERTADYWREWAHDHDGGQTADDSADTTSSTCVFDGPWHDAVVRSGLVLKLLTHVETGAIAAAPTTSFPEEIGGVRNWDYRYSWPRDAAFTVQALAHLGHLDEAGAYFQWFLDVCTDEPHDIQPLYGLHGEVDLEELELDHLEGYRGSRPVRIGNAAAEQRQLDVYGELVLAVSAAVHHGWSIGEDDWPALRDLIEYVAAVWEEPDSGIWEVRSDPKHFVHSKVMCWVALDRGIELAEQSGWDAPMAEWRTERDRIREAVLTHGFDSDRGTFTQSYDGDALDATALLFPLVGFLPFDDHRIEGTVAAVRDRLETNHGLLHRYDGEDGLPGDEGTFTLCSFWLVDVLALSGQVEEATERFEELLSFLGPLELFAEEIDPAGEGGIHRGNYPQAFSHVGLVNSALVLGRVRDPDTPGPEPVAIWLGEGPDVPG